MNDISEYMRIVEIYQESLYRYCFYKLSKNNTLADEAFDDVIHVLYQKWDTLDTGDNIKAYLYRVADFCIKNCRKKYYSYYEHNESLEENIERNMFDNIAIEDEYFVSDECSDEAYIKEITESLPEEYKEIFVYRFVEKKTINEISELVGIPYSSLRLRISKIEKIVRQKIKEIFK